MFIPLKMVLIGIDPSPFWNACPNPFIIESTSCLGETSRALSPMPGVRAILRAVPSLRFNASWTCCGPRWHPWVMGHVVFCGKKTWWLNGSWDIFTGMSWNITHRSLDGSKGKSAGNHRFYHQIKAQWGSWTLSVQPILGVDVLGIWTWLRRLRIFHSTIPAYW